jgi:aspartate aminotransferase-like enzyme
MPIQKQRLLTPGPTPLYPKALQAMMGAEIHHRTQDFRDLYLSVLASLKTVLGTTNDVLILASSGTGAMEASITNCFSPGDRVIVCSAGKFGERWVQLAKAYGIESVEVEAPYGQTLPLGEMKIHLDSTPGFRAVFVQSTDSSTGVLHDV